MCNSAKDSAVVQERDGTSSRAAEQENEKLNNLVMLLYMRAYLR
jgi:hypothetical protein